MSVTARSVLLGSLVAAAAVVAAAAKDAFPPGAALAVDPSRDGGVAADPAEPRQSRGVCGGFSAEGRYDGVPVAWSFRLCEVAVDAYEVQVRFRNVSRRPARPVRFEYRVWLERPGTCAGSAPESSPLVEGEKALRPGEVDEWPYTVGVALRRAYRGEIWSCALERRDSEESN